MTIVMATVMVLAAVPAGLAIGAWTGEGGAVPRDITNDENDLIIPVGESLVLSGAHSYAVSVQILGTLKMKPYDDIDQTSGMISLSAPNITIGPNGRISGEGRGFGGGGGGTSHYSGSYAGGSGGTGGSGGKGGNGVSGMTYNCGGGGGSNGGAGGTGNYGSGSPGTESGGGKGGSYSSYAGGAGGAGFGGGGGGGGNYYQGGGGGGGGGGTGGKSATNQNGASGAGPFGGSGGAVNNQYWAATMDGKNGGYLTPGGNGDGTTDLSVGPGGGGGGGAGSNYYTGSGGGGGAGGGAVKLIATDTVTIAGTISTAGAPGGAGGQYSSSQQYTGGLGGGGAGGGVALSGRTVLVTGTINAQGIEGNAPSTTNGGSVKVAYGDKYQASGTILCGRLFVNANPRMNGLVSPPDKGEVAPIPVFTWNAATDLDRDPMLYHLQVATVPEFAPPVIDEAGLKKTTYVSPGPLASGTTYYWRVAAYDPVGPGSWSEVWTFTIDVTPPVSKVNDLPKYTTAHDFELTWSGEDNALSISTYTIYVSDNNQGFIPWQTNTPKTSALFSGVEGHNYRFFSSATDLAGNREGAHLQADALTTIDTRPPVSTLELLSPYLNTTMIHVAWSAKDNTSGVANYSVFVSVDNGEFMPWLTNTLQKGSTYTGMEGHMYQFYVRAFDNAGNFEAVPDSGSILTVRVDLTPPATAISMGWPTFGERPVYILPQNEITFSQGDNYAGVNTTFYIIDGQLVKEYNGPFRETQFGPHTITFWSADLAGNEETRQTLSFFTDGEAPASSLEFEGPNFTKSSIVYIAGTTLIILSARDRGSGVNRTEYNFGSGDRLTYTEPFKLRTTGSIILYYRSVDNLGTTELDKNIRLALDTTPPVTTPSYPLGPQNRDISVRLTASDYESGLAGTFHRVLKGGEVVTDWTPGIEISLSAETDHSKDGTYRVEFYSTDGVGNAEAVKYVIVTIDTVASLAVGIKGGEKADKETFTVKGKAEPGARVSINQKPVTVLNDGTFTAVVVLKSGSNKLSITSTDPAGNSITVTKSVEYSPPLTIGPNLVMMLVVVLIVVAMAGAALALRRKPA